MAELIWLRHIVFAINLFESNLSPTPLITLGTLQPVPGRYSQDSHLSVELTEPPTYHVRDQTEVSLSQFRLHGNQTTPPVCFLSLLIALCKNRSSRQNLRCSIRTDMNWNAAYSYFKVRRGFCPSTLFMGTETGSSNDGFLKFFKFF